MAARVFRGIAIFFLLYTGAEMTAPQYCSEAFGRITSEISASNVTSTPTAVSSHSDKEQQPQRHSSGEEDCFCCCAHVLPAIPDSLNAAPAMRISLVDLQKSGLASPPLQSPYHPPKVS